MKSVKRETVEKICKAIYDNSKKKPVDQESARSMSDHISINVNTFNKVRNIMRGMNVLIITGQRAAQRTAWNADKANLNSSMIEEIYRIYTKDSESKMKIEVKHEKRLPSLDRALEALVSLGYEGIIVKSIVTGYITKKEEIDLSKIKVGE